MYNLCCFLLYRGQKYMLSTPPPSAQRGSQTLISANGQRQVCLFETWEFPRLPLKSGPGSPSPVSSPFFSLVDLGIEGGDRACCPDQVTSLMAP